MSHTLDFTHLEGETDDNADFDNPGNNGAENSAPQVAIAIPPPPKVTRNKKGDDSNLDESSSSDAAVLPSVAQDHIISHNVSKSPSGGFEDSFINGPSVSSTPSSPAGQTNENGVEIPPEKNNNTAESDGATSPANTFKIQYDASRGNVTVLDGQVTTRPDGSQHISTQDIHEQWIEREQPLRKKRIRLIKIFSIIACIFFFPSGIAAIYYAFRIDKEFAEGIMRGNIDRAQKFAKRSERFIILSFVLFVLVAALTVALIERPYYDDRNYHRGTVTG